MFKRHLCFPCKVSTSRSDTPVVDYILDSGETWNARRTIYGAVFFVFFTCQGRWQTGVIPFRCPWISRSWFYTQTNTLLKMREGFFLGEGKVLLAESSCSIYERGDCSCQEKDILLWMCSLSRKTKFCARILSSVFADHLLLCKMIIGWLRWSLLLKATTKKKKPLTNSLRQSPVSTGKKEP